MNQLIDLTDLTLLLNVHFSALNSEESFYISEKKLTKQGRSNRAFKSVEYRQYILYLRESAECVYSKWYWVCVNSPNHYRLCHEYIAYQYAQWHVTVSIGKVSARTTTKEKKSRRNIQWKLISQVNLIFTTICE